LIGEPLFTETHLYLHENGLATLACNAPFPARQVRRAIKTSHAYTTAASMQEKHTSRRWNILAQGQSWGKIWIILLSMEISKEQLEVTKSKGYQLKTGNSTDQH